MNAPLVVAGVLALAAAALHGIAGEVLVVRKLSADRLAPSPFGGTAMTKAMIHATWHLTTVGFITAGVALIVAGSTLDDDAARAVALVAAGACTGFAAVVLAVGAGYGQYPRGLLRHPAPLVLTVTAALAWWGAL